MEEINKPQLAVVIDRIEGNLAVCSPLIGSELSPYNIPTQYLPDNVGEGDALYLTFRKETDAEHKERREGLDRLIEELTGKPLFASEEAKRRRVEEVRRGKD